MECCPNNSAGRVFLKINGVKYKIRVGVTVMPTNVEKEADATASGEVFVTVKAVPAKATFTLSDTCGLSLEELSNACDIDATIKLFDMNRTYIFPQASIVGRPELNTENGEITGFEIVSALARQVEG